MEDQGIMALPAGGMQAPTAQPPAQGFDPATAAAFEQARQQIDPREFGQELLSAAEQTDPAAVQQFKQAIERMQLPPEVIDALGQMVDAILAEPQNYAQIRQEFINEGVPEDLLPPEFDAVYFGAMNLALDQMSGSMQSMNVQKFAEGGIATLTPIAKMLSSYGRNGDTMLAHITPAEARMLRRRGGSGTINPITGLPEFFLKKVAKAVGNTLKSVGKAVSGAVKGIVNGVKDFAKSSVGKIVTSVALGFFLGPAAAGLLGVSSVAGVAAVSGFVGGFGSSILAGNSFKDALKNGAIGGVTAGATAGITGGMGAFESGSYAGPTTVAGQWDKAINSGKSLLGISTPSTAGTSVSAEQLGIGVDSIDAAAGVPTVEQLANVPPPDLTVGQQALSYDGAIPGQGVQVASAPPLSVTDAGGPYAGSIQNNLLPSDFVQSGVPVEGGLPSTTLSSQIPGGAADPNFLASSPTNLAMQGGSTGMIVPGEMPLPEGIIAKGSTGFGVPPSAATQPGFMDQLSSGDYTGAAKTAYGNTVDFFNPSAREAAANQAAESAYNSAYAKTLASTGGDRVAARAAATAAQNAAAPSFFSTYGPIVGAGLGAAYLGGAFTPEEPGSPNLAPKETGTDLLRAQPGVYGTTPGGANVTYASLPTGYNYSPMQMLYRPQVTMGNPYGNIYGQRRMFAQGGIAAVAPAKFNLGGYASGGIGSMAKKYPRRTGQISGPGTGTSDDIPAMLSDGEFVMTAKAVRGAGKGSRREGAKRMYAMMRKFEGKA
jgi:hypothetical protein